MFRGVLTASCSSWSPVSELRTFLCSHAVRASCVSLVQSGPLTGPVLRRVYATSVSRVVFHRWRSSLFRRLGKLRYEPLIRSRSYDGFHHQKEGVRRTCVPWKKSMMRSVKIRLSVIKRRAMLNTQGFGRREHLRKKSIRKNPTITQ